MIQQLITTRRAQPAEPKLYNKRSNYVVFPLQVIEAGTTTFSLPTTFGVSAPVNSYIDRYYNRIGLATMLQSANDN